MSLVFLLRPLTLRVQDLPLWQGDERAGHSDGLGRGDVYD